MVTQTRQGPYTYADYLETPDDERYELIEGELIMAAAPIPLHQRVGMRFSNRMGPFIEANGLGELFAAPIDVYFSNTNVFQPDLIFISAARTRIIGNSNIQGAPDLVIEIASPRTQRRDRTVKRDVYERYGVLEYWMTYPDTRTISVLRLENGRFVDAGRYQYGDTLTTPLLPGLAIALSEVFG